MGKLDRDGDVLDAAAMLCEDERVFVACCSKVMDVCVEEGKAGGKFFTFIGGDNSVACLSQNGPLYPFTPQLHATLIPFPSLRFSWHSRSLLVKSSQQEPSGFSLAMLS